MRRDHVKVSIATHRAPDGELISREYEYECLRCLMWYRTRYLWRVKLSLRLHPLRCPGWGFPAMFKDAP